MGFSYFILCSNFLLKKIISNSLTESSCIWSHWFCVHVNFGLCLCLWKLLKLCFTLWIFLPHWMSLSIPAFWHNQYLLFILVCFCLWLLEALNISFSATFLKIHISFFLGSSKIRPVFQNNDGKNGIILWTWGPRKGQGQSFTSVFSLKN